jgi:hypothetical protein
VASLQALLGALAADTACCAKEGDLHGFEPRGSSQTLR